jgi:hypothetical protein
VKGSVFAISRESRMDVKVHAIICKIQYSDHNKK